MNAEVTAPYDDYRITLSTIKSKMNEAQAGPMRLRSDMVKKTFIPTDDQLRTVWNTASLEWTSSVIKLLVKKVVIHPRPAGHPDLCQADALT